MTCHKCHGLMIHEHRTEFTPATNVWRCINCGQMVDPLIAENRRLQALHRDPVGKAA
ncbi:MAG: hypothetical protein U0172_11330 [Nitrospiraceae bacterium]